MGCFSIFVRLQNTWPAFILLSVILMVSASMACAQDSPGDASTPARMSRPHVFGNAVGQMCGIVSFETDSNPAGGAVVTARSMISSETHFATTDPMGRFQIDGLPMGPYTVIAQASGYESASSTTSVQPACGDVTLSLKPVNASASGAGTAPTVSVHELKVPSKAQDFYQKGLQRLEKDPATSADYFTKAISKYSDYYEAYYQLGQAQARLKQTGAALKSFQTAIDLSGGKFAPAEFAYGLLLCNQGKAKDAERIVRQGLEQDSNQSFGHLALGVVLLKLGRPDEAEKSAREVLLRNPRFPEAYLVLADAHGAKKDYAAEIKDLDAFLSLAPDGPRSDFARQLRSAAQRLASEFAHPSQTSQIPQRPDVLNVEPTKP